MYVERTGTGHGCALDVRADSGLPEAWVGNTVAVIGTVDADPGRGSIILRGVAARRNRDSRDGEGPGDTDDSALRFGADCKENTLERFNSRYAQGFA
jgi:hypothetical protein